MKKLELFFLILIACLISNVISWVLSCAKDAKDIKDIKEEQLVIYTWEDMFPQEIINAFEKANPGLKVILKTFEENEEMLDELIRTDGGKYDLVIADDYIVEFITHPEWKLAQKLDKSKLPNISNVDPVFAHQFYDPNDEYTVPYGAGVQTIMYNPAKTQLKIKSYADLWDKTLRNSVGIIGNYRVIDGMALKVMGKSYNTADVTDIENAGQKLLSLAPNIFTIADVGIEDDLLDGTISAAVMYTDQVMKSKLANPDLEVVYPTEGIGFGIMPAFIPSNAPNADAAHRFLNFILDPERGARCFEYMGYYCTFSASRQYISPELKDYLIMPDFRNVEMIRNISQEAEDAHNRIWQDFLQTVFYWY